MMDERRIDRVLTRLRELATITDDVLGERDIAIYEAHRLGLSEERIARAAYITPADVTCAVAAQARDEDPPAYDESVTWVRLGRWIA